MSTSPERPTDSQSPYAPKRLREAGQSRPQSDRLPSRPSPLEDDYPTEHPDQQQEIAAMRLAVGEPLPPSSPSPTEPDRRSPPPGGPDQN